MTNVGFVPIEQQQEFFLDGGMAIKSRKVNSSAILATTDPQSPNGERIKLAVSVLNTGSEHFTLDTSDIKVISNHKKPIKVYSYDELVKEEIDRRNTMLVLAAISGAANAYSASQAGTSYTSGNFQSNTLSSSGYNYNTNGTFNSTTYDPYKAQIAQQQANAQSQQNIQNIQGRSETKLSDLRSGILKKTTVFPGATHFGIIVFDAPPLKPDELRNYKLQLTLNGEVHIFELAQKKNSDG
ncbi:MAG: hypothetical protein AAFN43_07940 [Pseudomonadota bacterium]